MTESDDHYNSAEQLRIRTFPQSEYEPIWHAMQELTEQRDKQSADELWFVEHPPVFTLGLNGKRKHLLKDTDIPVINVDRGGQITYHGPGQIVVYTLFDLERHHWDIKGFVDKLEQAIINLLASYDIKAERLQGAPGVYVNGAKIAALGLRIKHGRSYHGLSLNIDMDLSPFGLINPCGYENMPVTQLSDFVKDLPIETVRSQLLEHIRAQLEY